MAKPAKGHYPAGKISSFPQSRRPRRFTLPDIPFILPGVKSYFKRRYCQSCGKDVDPTFPCCPHCGGPSPDPYVQRAYGNFLQVSIYKQIGFLALSLFGLSLIMLVVQAILLAVNAPADPDGYNEYIGSGEFGILYLSISYCLAALAAGLLLWKDWGKLLQSFAKWKNVLLGIGFAAIIIVATVAYGMLVTNPVYEALGVDSGTTNANQGALNSAILASPIVSCLILSLVGPFCEELGYRVGLFGLSSRLGKVAGYIITIIVFALIHVSFSWESATEMVVELVNLPSYLIGGVLLTLAYDKFGFACSFSAHALYNLFSVLMNYASLRS